MISKSAHASTDLLDELQTTLAHGTVARRVETLRRVTDLFLNGAVDYSDEQIGRSVGGFRNHDSVLENSKALNRRVLSANGNETDQALAMRLRPRALAA